MAPPALRLGACWCLASCVVGASGLERSCDPNEETCAWEHDKARALDQLCAPTDKDEADSPLVSRLRETASLDGAIELGVNSGEDGMPGGFCAIGEVGPQIREHRCEAPGLVLRQNRSALPQLAANNTQGSLCAVSRRHRFIFVHVLKNAGTSTKEWLKAALCGAEECDRCTLSLEPCAEALGRHPGYFRWAWLRHPYDRALSVYAMAKLMKSNDTMDDTSFAKFWLAGQSRWNWTSLSVHHALPQAAFVSNSKSCLAMDFLGTLHRSDQEMGRIVDLLGVDELKEHYASYGFRRPAPGKNDFGTAIAKSRGESAWDMVRGNQQLTTYLNLLYEEDFALFHRCDGEIEDVE